MSDRTERAGRDIEITWPASPQALQADPRQIHVYAALLDHRPDSLRRWEGMLSGEERARAAGMVLPRGGDRYVTAHGILREILSGYLDVPPSALRFAEGPQGKPALIGPGSSRLRFTMAHADGLGIWAVANDVEVGVDVERVRERPRMRAIAARHFAPAERSRLNEASPHAWVREFVRIWTRKEAVVKAIGEGLQIPLADFEVREVSGGVLGLADMGAHRHFGSGWTIRDLDPAPGFVGAVAARSPGLQVRASFWGSPPCAGGA